MMIKCADNGNNQNSSTVKKPSSSSHKSESTDNQELHCSRVLLTMSSIGIAAYIMTSGVMQITFTALSICLCGVTFSQDDPSLRVTWLVSTCWVMGLMRLLLSICIGRPSYNRSIWSKPSSHVGFDEQLKALAFLPDLPRRSQDLGVMDKPHLAAGIIHPGFYFRTQMVAWLEGLLSGLWFILHVMRLLKLPLIFKNEHFDALLRRDEYIDNLFASVGSNYSSYHLLISQRLSLQRPTEAIQMLRTPEMLNRLVSHTCELMSGYAAEMFYIEDIALLCILGLKLIILPAMSLLFKLVFMR